MAVRPLLPAVLRDCPDLQVLSDDEINHLADHAQVMILDAGDFLCYEGDTADVAWVLVSGEIVFLTEDKPRASYASLFGEAGLLTELPPSRRVAIQARQTSVVVSVPVVAFTIDGMMPKLRPVLVARQAHYLTTLPEAHVEDIFEMLRACVELQSLFDQQVQLLSDAAELVQFTQGETILHQGDPAEHVFVIVDGEVMYGAQGQPLSGPGTIFGEAGLLEEDDPRRRVFCVAHTDVTVLRIPNQVFTSEIRQSLQPQLEMMASFYKE